MRRIKIPKRLQPPEIAIDLHVETTVDLESVMREIDAARLEEAARQLRLQDKH